MKARWKMRHQINPGDIGYLIYLHGTLYAEESGYDLTFEAYVASGLAEFIQSYNPEKDRIWLAEARDQIIGSIGVVGRSKTVAQLRWFLVHPDYRGLGIGKKLLTEALQFCKECNYETVFLWTTSGQAEAVRLYARFGFKKTEEKTHKKWGQKVTEEKYELNQ